MDNLYIVIPAYNEEENIRKVVEQWYPLLSFAHPESKLIVADSGSTDQTHDILLELAKDHPQLYIMDDTLKQHGPKLIAMYKYAISQNADYVFQTDSDGQTNPDEFEAFWDLRNDADAIIGNRTIRGDGKIRKLVENVVCTLLRIFFKVKVNDANAPFRLFNCKVLSKYIDRFKEDYNLPNIMLVVFFEHYSERVIYKDISFKARENGKNSINLIKIFKIGLNAVKDFSNYKKTL